MLNKNSQLQDTLNFINNMHISFKDDPKYINLDTSLRIFIFSLIKFIRTAAALKNAQNYTLDDETTAGTLYNGIYITHPYSSNTTFTDEISDADFNGFCVIFKNNIDETKLSAYSKGINDPRLCTFEFLHYLFIPVRMDISTLSEDLKINCLRKFLTVVMFLPYMEEYTDRYLTALNNIEFIKKVHQTIFQDIAGSSASNITEKMINLNVDFIVKSLQTSYTTSNSMMVYLRVYTNLIILICIEILKKWCPNINECIRINPDFDGAWVNPFDAIVNDQLQYIQDLTKYTKTEKLKTK